MLWFGPKESFLYQSQWFDLVSMQLLLSVYSVHVCYLYVGMG